MPVVPGHPRISMDAEICGGKPRVTGTDIPVDMILKNMAAGASAGWIIQSAPQLSRDDIRAVLAYAKAIDKDRAAKTGT